MKIPNWVKPGFWGLVLGAIAITVVGFADNLVVTSGNAKEMAAHQSQDAVVKALTPICVFQFQSAPKSERVAILKELDKETYYLRGKYIEDHGWATMPGSTKPNEVIADECASKILQLKG